MTQLSKCELLSRKEEKEAEKKQKREEKDLLAATRENEKKQKEEEKEQKEAEKEQKKLEREKKKAAKEAAKGLPKKPLSAFFLFGAERRAKLFNEQPEMRSKVVCALNSLALIVHTSLRASIRFNRLPQMSETAKFIGEEWKSLSDEEKVGL